jgi:glycosyltransferase involved in cell wall biosynthesis
MRIHKVIHSWFPEGRGGTEIHARDVALALAARHHQVGVFARTSNPGQPEYTVTTEWQGPISVTRVNNTFQDLPAFPWVYKNRAIHEAYVRDANEFKPDLVHVHHLTGLSSTILEHVKGAGLPLVMTLHDFWSICPRGQRITKGLDLCRSIDRDRCYTCLSDLWPTMFASRDTEPTIVDVRGKLSPQILAEWDRHMAYVFNLCDVLIAPSAFHAERMLDFPIDPDRIMALPHGMNQDPIKGSARDPRRPVERIGFIGSVIPTKGVHVLVEAFRRLAPPGVELHIHGEAMPFHGDASYLERLKGLAEDLPVTFHGAYDVEALPRILAGLDILVVPSVWWESFCLTIREGLLAGVAVVASDLGAMREALDGERNGLLFRAGDPDDLAKKLARLIDDPVLREHLGDRSTAVKTMDVYATELEGIYERAQKIALHRSRRLIVAPPSFPSPPPDASPPADPEPPLRQAISWEKLRYTVRQEGPAEIALSTRKPTSDDPRLGLKVSIRDGERDLGQVHLSLDLGPWIEEGVQPTFGAPRDPVNGKEETTSLASEESESPTLAADEGPDRPDRSDSRPAASPPRAAPPTPEPNPIRPAALRRPPDQGFLIRRKPSPPAFRLIKETVSRKDLRVERWRVRPAPGHRRVDPD